jgi:hypothetical protein
VPELVTDKPKYSDKSDIFAYAITLWEMASRQLPYTWMHPAAVPGWVKQAERNREPIPPHCPPAFGNLIINCWKQAKGERWPLDTVIKELEKMQNNPNAAVPNNNNAPPYLQVNNFSSFRATPYSFRK